MIPSEMTDLRQWVVAGPDKRPYYWGGKILPSSVTDNRTWMDYTTATQMAAHLGLNIGFVLSSNDPFVCIDFDIIDAAKLDKNGQLYPENMRTPEVVINQQDLIVNSIDSYKEVSVSGKGIHLWVRGQSGPGARRGGVEVYSQERFIICTGRSFRTINRTIVGGVVHTTLDTTEAPATISEQDQFLTDVLRSLKRNNTVVELVEIEPTEADDVIIKRAMQASNAEKFITLARGNWMELNYPSQSEADLSLMSMLTFYSKSNSQCRRIFRMTELGKRNKAVVNDVYLNRTLVSIRARQAREEDMNLRMQLDGVLLAKLMEKEVEPVAVQETVNHIIEETIHLDVESPVEAIAGLDHFEKLDFTKSIAIDYPPGLIGETARFIYGSSPRPVKEVSIVGALGMFAGAAGRSYHLPQTGLNLYVILVAQSAVGKEAMHSGISLIIKSLTQDIPEITNFVDFSEYSSGPALLKSVGRNPSFVNVCGEFGLMLSNLSKGTNSAVQTLTRAITNLYQKSGPKSMVGGLKYSDKEKDMEIKGSVAYSVIGETTPGTLYESMTEEMMENGFLSRFSFIQYTGDRVRLNYHAELDLSAQLKQRLLTFFSMCATHMGGINENSTEVKWTHAAWLVAYDFGEYCDDKINSYYEEKFRQLWNRAHLKAIRIAGLLACADNPVQPIILIDHIKWSVNMVLEDIRLINSRLTGGDIGMTDDVRISKLKQLCKEYLKAHSGQLLKWHIDVNLQKQAIIPRKFLQQRTCGLPAFRNHRNGGTFAMNQAIQAMMDNGDLKEIDKLTAEAQFSGHGKVYRIIHI